MTPRMPVGLYKALSENPFSIMTYLDSWGKARAQFGSFQKSGAPLSTPNARALVFSAPAKRAVNVQKHLRTFDSGVKARALSEFPEPGAPLSTPNTRALVFSTPTKRTVNVQKQCRTFDSGVKARALSEFEKTRGSIIDPKC